MYCTKCGKKIIADMSYCSECGTATGRCGPSVQEIKQQNIYYHSSDKRKGKTSFKLFKTNGGQWIKNILFVKVHKNSRFNHSDETIKKRFQTVIITICAIYLIWYMGAFLISMVAPVNDREQIISFYSGISMMLNAGWMLKGVLFGALYTVLCYSCGVLKWKVLYWVNYSIGQILRVLITLIYNLRAYHPVNYELNTLYYIIPLTQMLDMLIAMLFMAMFRRTRMGKSGTKKSVVMITAITTAETGIVGFLIDGRRNFALLCIETIGFIVCAIMVSIFMYGFFRRTIQII